jgi:undecaprenyl-diphosphatase
MNYFEAVLLSLVEGLTEFLPVSSTGHLIVFSSLFGINEEGFVKDFNIIIQAGAILSVLFLYRDRFTLKKEFYLKIFVAFLPAAVIGLLVKKKIDLLLGSVHVVGAALILGGIILIGYDIFAKKETERKHKGIDDLTYLDCAKIGLIQCFAFIPGVSRAAATILGGLFLGLDKKSAAEFSFFLAVPTLMGAAVVKGHSALGRIHGDQWGLLLLGIFLSFVFAVLSIRFFIGILERTGWSVFGIYRIILGIAVFALL